MLPVTDEPTLPAPDVVRATAVRLATTAFGRHFTVNLRAVRVAVAATVMAFVLGLMTNDRLLAVGGALAFLIGGLVVTETVFSIPGIGQLVVSSVLRRDYPVIQGVTLIVAASYVLINLVVDVLYRVVDPRVKV